MTLLSSPLGNKYPTLSPVKLVGIRPQDLVDILHILWFLFCQGAHCICKARREAKKYSEFSPKSFMGAFICFAL